MLNQGGSGGGGGRGGYEGFSRESHPAPTYGRGRGQVGSQRSRGGFVPPPTAPPTMASSGSIESSLNRETEHLSLSEKKPVVVTPGSSSAIAPAPVDAPPQSSKCIARANHFLVEVTDNDLCHYDVVIAPETTSCNLNRLIITELVKLFQHSELGGRTPAYDGRKSLYTTGQLPFTSKTFAIKLPDIDPKANGREKEFSVTIKFSAKVDLHHLQQFLQRRQSDSPQGTIHALDVVLRESPCTKYKTVIGRSFFSPQFSTGENPDLGAGVEYCCGFYQSLRPTQMGLSLNIGLSVGENSCQPSVGQWNMMRMKMVNGGTVNNWACLNFSQTSEREVVKFCDDLVAMCNRKGMVFNTRPCINLIADNPTNLEAALRNLHQRASSNMPNGQLDLVIIILPEIRGSSYGMIKKVLETELGIVSQCCAPKHVSRCNQQYLENISLKINVKVGGRNTDALSKSDRPTINFGADVTHPDPGEDSSPSIAAVVASMDWPEVILEDLIANHERGQKLEEENSFSDDELYDGANYDLGLEDEPMEEEPTEEEPTEEEPLPMEEDDSGNGRTSSGTNPCPTEEEGSEPTGENFPTGPYNSLSFSEELRELNEEFARQDRIHEEEKEAYLSAQADPNQAHLIHQVELNLANLQVVPNIASEGSTNVPQITTQPPLRVSENKN